MAKTKKTGYTKNNLLLTVMLLLLAAAPQAIASDFLLFYANDVHGETDPCG
jgi:hypothetical protein